MLYSLNGQWPANLPHRIRMPSGSTRTDNTTFTDEEIAAAGYVQVTDPPATTPDQILGWDGSDWVVEDKPAITPEQKWAEVRQIRDTLIAGIQWRVERWLSYERLGMAQVDNISELDAYIQALRDVPDQDDPFNIVWPTPPELTPAP